MMLAACGSGGACDDCMVGCLEPKLWEAKEAGWDFSSRQTAELFSDRDDPRSFPLIAELRPFSALEYRFIGCGGPAFADVDILIYDENNTLIARDSQTGRDPVVDVSGETSRKLRVRLFAADLPAEREDAGLLIMVR